MLNVWNLFRKSIMRQSKLFLASC